MSPLRKELEWTKNELEIFKKESNRHWEKLQLVEKQLNEIKAENESLRSDKKWLQQMHSAVLQLMHAFVAGRRN